MGRVKERRPFDADDLHELDTTLLSRAHAVIALQEVHAGNRYADVIALRHDVDDNPHAFETATRMAKWEAERGYRSTYYLLHTAAYWGSPSFWPGVELLARLGHEIGIHTNAIAHALRTGQNPDVTLRRALAELRSHGFPVRGVVGHGDPLCRTSGFANDEHFVECARAKSGAADRDLAHGETVITLTPRPLADFDLAYEAVRLGRGYTQSDSGGHWLYPFSETVAQFSDALAGPAAAHSVRQLHLLVHPDWWHEALPTTRRRP